LGSYDNNFSLKPPLWLWLVMLYLARAFVLPFMSGVSSMSGGTDTSSLTRGVFGIEDFVPAALSLIVFVTAFRRIPSASLLGRRIWRVGRVILSVAAVVDMAVSIQRFLQLTDTESWRPQLLLLACIADAYILAYLLRSRWVRDVFSDFPAP